MAISQPANLPTVALIAPFVLLYVALIYTTKGLAEYMAAGNHAKSSNFVQRKAPGTIASTVVLVVALQSIGQLTARDLISVILVVVIGYFFMYRNGARQQ